MDKSDHSIECVGKPYSKKTCRLYIIPIDFDIFRATFCICGLHRSFIYNKNISGPRIDPCGTPHLMLLGDDLTPLYWTKLRSA